MKRIIDRKVYDTDTAELIAEWDNGYYGNDFNRCEEALYRTKSGAFFLCGEGGPMSKYARAVGNMTSGGEGITPLTDDEAYDWLEETGNNKAIESLFPDKISEA